MKGSKKKTDDRGADGSKKNVRDKRHAPEPAIEDDARFNHIRQDPLFRRVPKDKKRVNIDSRFGAMFNDDKFKLKYKVDKRGRPINLTTDENLKRYYNLVDEDEEKDGPPKEEIEKKDKDDDDSDESEDKDKEAVESASDNDEPSVDTEAGPLSEKLKKKLQDLSVDYARGEGVLNSDAEDESDDSSSDDSSSSEEDEGIEDNVWGELDKDAERTDEVTHRLALCNMDWDRIKSDDLMVLFNSFLPPGGVLKHVAIYPSEYGKKRLEEEELYGPRELREDADGNPKFEDSENEDDGEGSSADDDDSDTAREGFVAGEGEGEEGSSFHMERLRKYQLNRLKYYYAIMEFDSPETANKIYTECDGLEFESSATKLDLRFIPDDLNFDEEPRDKCDSMPSTEKYIPKFFTTTALQQMKVDLTWDETDPERQRLTQKVHDPKEKVDDEDLRAYLASSSGEEEDEEEKDEDGDANGIVKKEADEDDDNAISKYRALLESIQDEEKKKKEKDVEMEITWGVGLKKTTENLVKKKLTEEKAKKMTPWEEMLAKKQEKKKLKRVSKGKEDDDEIDEIDKEDQEVLTNDSESEDGKPFSDDDVDVDMNDPFFKEELESDQKQKKSKNSKKGSKGKTKIELNDEEKKEKKDSAAALELLLMDDEPVGASGEKKSHFNMKKIIEAETETKSKKKKKLKKRNKKKGKADDEEEEGAPTAAEKQDNFQIDLQDERFNALYTSHKFNLDPSDPNFKQTKAMSAIISEKQKRRKTAPTASDLAAEKGPVKSEVNTEEDQNSSSKNVEAEPPTKISRKAELSSLVKSIKRNTENLLQQKKNKFVVNWKKTT